MPFRLGTNRIGRLAVGTGAETPSYLLDDYSGAVGAYSLRRLSTDYRSFAVRVYRSGDAARESFGFDSNGDLDTAAMEAWVQAGGGTQDGFVEVWYDQSGNNNHQVQATLNNMPAIVDNGSTILTGGKPAIDFNGSNDFMSRANIISNTADKTTFNVYYPESMGTLPIMELSAVAATGQPWTLTVEPALRCSSRTYVTTAGSINTHSLLEVWQDGITINDANQFKLYFNGAYEARTSGADGDLVTSTSPFNIGYSPNGGGYFNGTQQEILIYPSALTDVNREGVRDNINTYYSVY